jgi:galactonate dehydratase
MPAAQLRRNRLAAFVAAQVNTTTPSGPLAISEIRAWPVREPVSRRAYTVLRVSTSGGIAGYGETRAVAPAELESARGIVLHRQATEFEVLRPLLSAIPSLQAAVNMALLDIVGKAAKAPVYQVLGGPTRHKVRTAARLEGGSDSALSDALRRAQSAGFRAFLVPVASVAARNQGQAFVLANRKRLEALRSQAGEQADFILDCAGDLSPGDASSLSAACERFHLLWLDEPCGLAAMGAVRKIAAERVTPLGFGRALHDGAAFQDLLREDSIDVFRPNLALNGISQVRRFAALAEANYVAVAPYHEGGPVATAAAFHLAASIPNFFIQQMPFPEAADDRRMRAELAGASLETVTDGFAALPTGPGLGITVNESALEKYREVA